MTVRFYILLSILRSISAAKTVYVSPLGCDATGEGTRAQPLRTLIAAQRKVRAMIKQVNSRQNITVEIDSGDYFASALTLTHHDGPGVTWRGPPAANPPATLYGGIRISDWTRWKGHVWQARLNASLVDGAGRSRFRQVVQGERSAWLARQPNYGSGYLPVSSSANDHMEVNLTQTPWAVPRFFDCVNSSCGVFTRAGYSSNMRNVTAVAFNATTNVTRVNFTSANTSDSRGSFYIEGALELLDREGEWAVRHGVIYFWPYSAGGVQLDPNTLVVTAPIVQQVVRFVGPNRSSPARGITLQNLHVVGSDMPGVYVYNCGGTGAQGSPSGVPCGSMGGGEPATTDETNTSPRAASQGLVYMENATEITVRNCVLKAAGIAAVWFEEANTEHVISGNWIEDIRGFGIYLNGVETGDRRYGSAAEADVSHGHIITNNVFLDGGRSIVYGSGVWLYQTGSTTITHNVISRFPRDGVGFYGVLPFWTADPGGPIAPGQVPTVGNKSGDAGDRMPWGKYVSWNGGTVRNRFTNVSFPSYSSYEVLYTKHNYLAYNDISNTNREGLDGGVIESWGASINNTWEHNALHDNEGYSAMELFFSDDFSPDLKVRGNIAYSNNCVGLYGANCAVFMLKSVNNTVADNVVADSNVSRLFETTPYRMPAANMTITRNVLWNTTGRHDSAEVMGHAPMGRAGRAYVSSCAPEGMWRFCNATTFLTDLNGLDCSATLFEIPDAAGSADACLGACCTAGPSQCAAWNYFEGDPLNASSERASCWLGDHGSIASARCVRRDNGWLGGSIEEATAPAAHGAALEESATDAAHAPRSCNASSFLTDTHGTQCRQMTLPRFPEAASTNETTCQAACCDEPSCVLFQWCDSNHSAPATCRAATSPSTQCWLGLKGGVACPPAAGSVGNWTGQAKAESPVQWYFNPEEAQLNDVLLLPGNENRQLKAQLGFTEAQLKSPLTSLFDFNFAGGYNNTGVGSGIGFLRASKCSTWDRNSVELNARPFAPTSTPWHSRTHLDYAIDPRSALVVEHGFRGAFDVRKIGLTTSFPFDMAHFKVRDAYGIVQAERYDRIENLWTDAGIGLGSGMSCHNNAEAPYDVPPGSWARFDGLDFGAESAGAKLDVIVNAAVVAGGARVEFKLRAPDSGGLLLASVVICNKTSAPFDPLANPAYAIFRSGGVRHLSPSGVHSVFVVFEEAAPSSTAAQGIGAVIDWFSFAKAVRVGGADL